MELTINVDETKFGEVLQKELDALSKEDLRDLIKDGLCQLLTGDTSKSYEQSVLLKYFIEKNTSYYGSGGWRPTSILEGIIKSTTEKSELWEDLVKDIQSDIIKVLKENYKDIIMNTFIRMFTETISNKVVGTNEFQISLNQMMQGSLYQHLESYHKNQL